MMKTKHIIQLSIIVVVAVIAVWAISINRKNDKPARPKIVKYNPIGMFYTNLDNWDKVPRQGRLAQHIKGTIDIFEEYHPGLRTLADFEYIIVTYHFHLVNEWDEEVTPPGGTKSRGILASRSPYRPNPIGLTVCRLDSIKGGTLYISGVDAYDHTPVLDIKPYLPSVDCIEGADKSVEVSMGIDDMINIDSVPQE